MEGNDNKIYLVHAKDNIPFHTVIFPSLLLGTKDGYKLPDKIVSDEYLTIEGEKLLAILTVSDFKECFKLIETSINYEKGTNS